jgi:hypothetical protein
VKKSLVDNIGPRSEYPRKIYLKILFISDIHVWSGQWHGIVFKVVQDLALPPVADGGGHGSKAHTTP